jgi:hypothetical protein
VTAPVKYGANTAAFLGDGRDAEAEATHWLVPGLVPVGLPTMFAGLPKSRKSLLAYHVAIAVAAGVPVLGQPTQRGRVLVISREDGAHETRRRLWQISRGLGVDLAQLGDEWIKVDTSVPLHLDRPADVAQLRATMQEFKPALVLIDSLSRVNTADENDRGSMAAVTNAWNDLCHAHDCTVVMIHHEGKGARGSVLQRVRGTGDLVALARVVVGVTKLDARRSRIEVDGNLADMSAPFEVSFVDGDAAGMKSIAITTEGASKVAAARPTAERGVTDEKSRDAAAKMLAFAYASEFGATKEELYAESGVGAAALARVILKDLVQRGALVFVARNKRGSTFPLLLTPERAQAESVPFGSEAEMRDRLKYGEAAS